MKHIQLHSLNVRFKTIAWMESIDRSTQVRIPFTSKFMR